MSETRRYNQTANLPLISAVDMPLASSYRERPLRIPAFSTDVLGIVLLLFIFGSIAGWAFTDSWQKGIGMGAAAAVVGIIWRTRAVFDKPLANIEEATYQEVETPSSSPPDSRIVDRNNEPFALVRPSKTVEYGDKRYTFSGKNLDTLQEWCRAGNRQLRRDSGAAGQGLREIGINNEYTTVIEVLRGRGLIDGGNVWTAAGEGFLNEQ